MTWKEVGLRRAGHGWLVVLNGSILAVSGIYLSEKIISPLLRQLTGGSPARPAEWALLQNNLPYFLFLLAGIWLLAATGEELVYRGYVLNRLTDLFGSRPAGWGMGLLASALLFGLGHGLSRPVLVSGFLLGLVEAGLYLANRRNLWLPIVFHGVWDSTYLTLFYLGLK
jgi:membrane protease YdiL (CAAX protease family)